MKCACVDKVTIILETGADLGLDLVQDQDPAITKQLQASLTQSLKTMTKLRNNLQYDLDRIDKVNQSASELKNTLKIRLRYLTAALIEQRSTELIQQLHQVNQPIVKSLQLELANLNDLIKICDNVLKRLRSGLNLNSSVTRQCLASKI